ncbi:hypothetical protein R3X27_18890 [Tropicimonas sp. TH_r6]|uniref:hypothetical protein n=1 Tax=Tropicimonas sp. TH_r6 TaxID=3082085 RepID=UPI002953F9E9|nr:hypothetical protein [Tropicimonas sp. TH_r6]MDV7144753.1 hypothetical protein [Tropicimonas sp. TH_r6]
MLDFEMTAIGFAILFLTVPFIMNFAMRRTVMSVEINDPRLQERLDEIFLETCAEQGLRKMTSVASGR